mgnify:CR=1 FL=1
MESLDWKKILFVTLGITSLVLVFLWKWWLGIIYFLIICYGAKRVTYSLLPVCFYCNTRPCFNIPIKRDSCHAFFVLSYSLTFL